MLVPVAPNLCLVLSLLLATLLLQLCHPPLVGGCDPVGQLVESLIREDDVFGILVPVGDEGFGHSAKVKQKSPLENGLFLQTFIMAIAVNIEMDEIMYPGNLSREEWLKVVEEEKHPFYKYPENPKQKIWRYMDFTKFVALIDKEALFFPRSTLLDDKYEGSISQETINIFKKKGEQELEFHIGRYPNREIPPEMLEVLQRKLSPSGMLQSKFTRWSKKWTYISCWHMNEHESAAMWSLYASSNQAIAISSTFKQLFECLKPHIFPGNQLTLGMVYYLDYSKEAVPKDFYLSEFFHKRKSFQHESELRAVVQDLPVKDGPKDENGIINYKLLYYDRVPVAGKSFPIDIENLIEEVYVAPTSPEWFLDLTQRILRKYGIDRVVKRSSLDGDPLF